MVAVSEETGVIDFSRRRPVDEVRMGYVRFREGDVIFAKITPCMGYVLPEIPANWEWTTIGEAGDVLLGRQRAPQHHSGPNMRPYLRVANVLEDRIDISDLKCMNFTLDEFDKYHLQAGIFY
jgi:hypothetical protein